MKDGLSGSGGGGHICSFVLVLFVECQAVGRRVGHIVPSLTGVTLVWNRDTDPVITPINAQLQLC